MVDIFGESCSANARGGGGVLVLFSHDIMMTMVEDVAFFLMATLLLWLDPDFLQGNAWVTGPEMPIAETTDSCEMMIQVLEGCVFAVFLDEYYCEREGSRRLSWTPIHDRFFLSPAAEPSALDCCTASISLVDGDPQVLLQNFRNDGLRANAPKNNRGSTIF